MIIETTPSIFSNQNGTKLDISNRRKTGKFTNMWNQATHSWIINGSKKQLEIKKFLKQKKIEI